MSIFAYRASDRSGKVIKGSIEADNEVIAAKKLHDMSYFPIKIEKYEERRTFSVNFSFSSLFKWVKEKDIMTFTQQLSTLIDAGMPLDRSLTIVTDLIEKKNFKTIVQDVQKNVHGGASFADALSRHPNAFSKLYTSMVKAGEAGGILESILEKLSIFLENSYQLKESIRSAMIYPVLLTIVGGAAVAVLLTFVVPKFAEIFSDMGQVIPLPTQILLNISWFIINYSLFMLLTIVTIIIGFRIYLATDAGRGIWDAAKLKIPLIGDLIVKAEVSRFSRTLGTLMKSGVPILQSLNIVKDTLTNASIVKSMTALHNRLKRGGGLSEPLKNSNIFPSMAVHMIVIGEETGKLEDMLVKVAETYDREVQVAVKRVIAIIEPLMILFMGLLVGFIVVSMLMAIFSVNDIPF